MSTATPWRDLLPRLRFLVLALVVFGTLSTFVVRCKVLNQTPWMAAPAHVNVCERTYNLSHLAPVRREVALLDAELVVGTVQTWQGSRKVWGVHRETTCGFGVYVETGQDEFVAYGLSGGP